MATPIPVTRAREARAGGLRRPLEMFEEMERWAERMLPLPWMRPPHLERMFWGAAIPQVDVVDREAEIVVRAAVPGFGKDDIEVTTTNDAVTIRGKACAEETEEGEYTRREISCEDFLRTVHLPCLVDDSKAKATFRDGILELMLPKAETVKRHTIKIEEA